MDLDAPIISGLRRNRPAAAATSNSNRHSAAPRPLSSIDVHDPTQQLPVNLHNIVLLWQYIFLYLFYYFFLNVARQLKLRSPLHLHVATGHGQGRCLQMLRHGIQHQPFQFIQVELSFQNVLK